MPVDDVAQPLQKFEKLDRIFEYINSGILLINDEFQVCYANQWVEMYHGKPLTLGQTFDQIFDLSDKQVQRIQRKIRSVLSLNSPSFVSAEHEGYLLPFKNTKVLNPQFEFMQQEATLMPFDHGFVLVLIYDQTAFMISRQEVVAQSRVLSDSLEKLLKAHRKLEDQTNIIERQANFDQLTELPNRTLLKDRVESALHQARKAEHKVALIYIDLDRFKAINDHYGSMIGDQLLQKVALDLQSWVAPHDTVARLASDEFVVCFTQLSSLERVSEMLRLLLDALKTPWIVAEQTIFVSASIGVSVFPDDSDDCETLLSHADLAMEKAKEQAGSAYFFYKEGLDDSVKAGAYLEMELKGCVDQKGLEVVWQPKYHANEQGTRLIGAEALIRWQHPQLGNVSPDVFIPIAERMGFITNLTLFVFEQVCVAQRRLLDLGIEIRVSVNISSLDLQHCDFFDSMCQILHQYHLPEGCIELEITERMALDSKDDGYQLLQQLRDQGMLLSLDDFGTGYSSLSYLADVPLDIVKIDKSFLDQAMLGKKHQKLLKNIIILAQDLGLETIAEGVETKEMMTMLIDYQCYVFQGFYFGRPASFDYFLDLCIQSKEA